MALIIADRVRETTAVTSTGTATLLGAVTGYQSFAAVGNTNTTFYCIVGQGTVEWEVGIGTYTSSGTTLSRDTVLASSNAGALVSFSAGTKDVTVTYPAERSVIDLHIQTQKYTAFTTAGTATAFTLTPVPALAAYVTGNRFFITLHTTIGANPTISISGLGDLSFTCYHQSGVKLPLNSTQAPSGWSSDCFYDGTDIVMINTLPNSTASVVTLKAIFGYGTTGSNTAITNLVSNVGVVATDTTGVGSVRQALAAAGYGFDKAIFGYGTAGGNTAITNLVSNTGVVATDTSGVGTARRALSASRYGLDKAIFGYGLISSNTAITNLVSNTGVVASDTTGVGTARQSLASAGYGTDKVIFGYGYTSTAVSMTNLVSNTGVVTSDTAGVGTARRYLAAAGYDFDKALFGYGLNTSAVNVSITNLISNVGVVASDITGVGTARQNLAAARYGTDKAIFGYGYTTTYVSMTNLVSNTGVVATDTTGVGTARNLLAAAGYSST